MKFRLVLAVLLCLSFMSGGFKQIQVLNTNPETVDRFWQLGVDPESLHLRPGAYIDVILEDEEFQVFLGWNLPYEIIHDNLESFYASRLTTPYSREFGLGSMGGYYTFDEMIQHLN